MSSYEKEIAERIDLIEEGTNKSSEAYIVQFDVLEDTKERFKKALEEGTEILIEDTSKMPANSIAIKLNYIGDKWCMGYEERYYGGELIKVPHTINYMDLYCKTQSNKGGIKIIFEGENPFG